MNHLEALEAEAIFLLREVGARFKKPLLLFSGGKDSACLVHLSLKAFCPDPLPFPLVHIDTGHNFEEALAFRDRLAERTKVKLIVKKVEDSIKSGTAKDPPGPNASRNLIQSITLKEAIKDLRSDCAIGGARRDEEKARAKERVFSFRKQDSSWDPNHQRPELWNIYNTLHHEGEHFRAFPLSNWTEEDIWAYIVQEKMDLPSIYFSHKRKCVVHGDGRIMALSEFYQPQMATDQVKELQVRCRTVGDMTCTGLIESAARTREEILEEVKGLDVSERGGRLDDQHSVTAMEDRKREGYF